MGLYIDDLGLVYVCARSEAVSPLGPDRDLMIACKKAARDAGLVCSEPKGFGFGIEQDFQVKTI